MACASAPVPCHACQFGAGLTNFNERVRARSRSPSAPSVQYRLASRVRSRFDYGFALIVRRERCRYAARLAGIASFCPIGHDEPRNWQVCSPRPCDEAPVSSSVSDPSHAGEGRWESCQIRTNPALDSSAARGQKPTPAPAQGHPPPPIFSRLLARVGPVLFGPAPGGLALLRNRPPDASDAAGWPELQLACVDRL